MKNKSKIILLLTIIAILLIIGFVVYLLLTPVPGLENYVPGSMALDTNTKAGKVF